MSSINTNMNYMSTALINTHNNSETKKSTVNAMPLPTPAELSSAGTSSNSQAVLSKSLAVQTGLSDSQREMLFVGYEARMQKDMMETYANNSGATDEEADLSDVRDIIKLQNRHMAATHIVYSDTDLTDVGSRSQRNLETKMGEMLESEQMNSTLDTWA